MISKIFNPNKIFFHLCIFGILFYLRNKKLSNLDRIHMSSFLIIGVEVLSIFFHIRRNNILVIIILIGTLLITFLTLNYLDKFDSWGINVLTGLGIIFSMMSISLPINLPGKNIPKQVINITEETNPIISPQGLYPNFYNKIKDERDPRLI